jgi:hypothetical protein
VETQAWTPSHPLFTEDEFKPYVKAIGRLALAWNDLHERLGMLFWAVLGGGWKQKPIGIWNSANFDRPKRAMLRAAVHGCTSAETSAHPSMVDDIEWILTKADALEDKRNNAVHSPLILTGNQLAVLMGYAPVVPDKLLENPRAMKLAKTDLLDEFKWCFQCTLVLRDYAALIERALTASGTQWPDRPSLPSRKQKKTLQLRNRQSQKK